MSSPSPQSVRQRGGHSKKRGANADAEGAVNGKADHSTAPLTRASGSNNDGLTSDWDYKVALVVLTILAVCTRFYGIGHPNQVVFDEVHFGKVSNCSIHSMSPPSAYLCSNL